jgi:hypothetical protein
MFVVSNFVDGSWTHPHLIPRYASTAPCVLLAEFDRIVGSLAYIIPARGERFTPIPNRMACRLSGVLAIRRLSCSILKKVVLSETERFETVLLPA